MSPTWVSLHVYHERIDALLSSCVAPLTQTLQARGLILRFFFLRYWEGGVHLRLRLLCRDGHAADLAREEACSHLREHLTHHPSEREIDEAAYVAAAHQLAALENKPVVHVHELVPNDSVCVAPYEPEYAKYGGRRGIEIAEALFARSSASALMLLRELEERRSVRLRLAFTMMMLALHHFGMPPERAPTFLARYEGIWSAYGRVPGDLLEVHGERLRPSLVPVTRALLAGRVPQHAATRLWAEAVATAARLIDGSSADVLPHVDAPGNDDARRASLLVHYIHTHNNRLGLAPAEEAYLARLGSLAMGDAA